MRKFFYYYTRIKRTKPYRIYRTLRSTLSYWLSPLGTHPETGKTVRVDFKSAYKTAKYIWLGK